jgi:hypothetical protein
MWWWGGGAILPKLVDVLQFKRSCIKGPQFFFTVVLLGLFLSLPFPISCDRQALPATQTQAKVKKSKGSVVIDH